VIAPVEPRESPNMGSVLLFRPRAARVRRKPLPAGTAAAIVIFPGVRYEREAPAGSRGGGAPLHRAAEVRQEFPAPRR
jgi:hypothetical protein